MIKITKELKINWKKVLAVSCTPFIPIYLLWFLLNPPIWARNSPEYTIRRMFDKDFRNAGNPSNASFQLPPIPTDTRPLLLFQIYPPGSKYSILYAYDYLANDKIEFALYGLPHPPNDDQFTPKSELETKLRDTLNLERHAGLVVNFINQDTQNALFSLATGNSRNQNDYTYYEMDIYLYASSTNTAKKVYTTESYGKCSHAIYWNEDTHEIYAESVYPVSSEDYVKEYCIIDDTTGKIRSIFLQPNYQSKQISGGIFDEDTKRMVIYESSKTPGGYLVDFPKRSVRYIDPGFKGGFSPKWDSLRDSKVLLLASSDTGYVVYDMRTQKASSFIKYPDEGISKKYSHNLTSISPSHEYLLFTHIDQESKNICYFVTNYQTNSIVTQFCNEALAGEDSSIYFTGWKE